MPTVMLTSLSVAQDQLSQPGKHTMHKRIFDLCYQNILERCNGSSPQSILSLLLPILSLLLSPFNPIKVKKPKDHSCQYTCQHTSFILQSSCPDLLCLDTNLCLLHKFIFSLRVSLPLHFFPDSAFQLCLSFPLSCTPCHPYILSIPPLYTSHSIPH